MKAAIIAAGEGSRLRAEGVTLPKPLVQVNGIPLLERLLDIFSRSGITEAVCIINEASLAVKEHIERVTPALPVHFIVKSTPSSMHSLFALSSHVHGGQFLLSTVDTIFLEDDLAAFLLYAAQHPGLDGLLAVTEFVDDESPLYVELDGRTVCGFSKERPTRWVTGGLYIFSPRIFQEQERALALGIGRLRNYLAHLVAHGYAIESFPFRKMIDVDRLHDVRSAEQFLAER